MDRIRGLLETAYEESRTMTYVLLRHKVANYQEFKNIYDADARHRRRRGSKSARLFRSVEDPNVLVMLFEWDDPARAHNFAEGYELHEAMEWASVVGEWSIDVLEEVEESDA
jgi:hypothetical protein